MATNPFASLMSDSSLTKADVGATLTSAEEGAMIERIFLFSLQEFIDEDDMNNSLTDGRVYLEAALELLEPGEADITLSVLPSILFERVIMTREQLRDCPSVRLPASTTITHSQTHRSARYDSARRADPITYMYECCLRSYKETNQALGEECREALTQCASVILQQPELVEHSSPSTNIATLFASQAINEDFTRFLNFLFESIEKIPEDEPEPLHAITNAIMSELVKKLKPLLENKLSDSANSELYIKSMNFFNRSKSLAQTFWEYVYDHPILDIILSSSCANKIASPPNTTPGELFYDIGASRAADLQSRQAFFHMNMELIVNGVHRFIMGSVRVEPNLKERILEWFLNIVKQNEDRVKLAQTSNVHGPTDPRLDTDGYMVNVCGVLLRMCEPFATPYSPKLLKIQPTFCHSHVDCHQTIVEFQRGARTVREKRDGILADLAYMIPLEKEQIFSLQHPEEFGFVTELFYITQFALYVGFHAASTRMHNLLRQLNRMDAMYQRIRSGEAVDDSESIKFIFEGLMSRFYTLKTVLTDDTLLKPLLQFHLSSCTFLTHLAMGGGGTSTEFNRASFPLPELDFTSSLGCQPEFLINNIVDALETSRNLKKEIFRECSSMHVHIIDLVLVLMGSKSRLRNPHLRAKLASLLFMLLPSKSKPDISDDFIKEALFTKHANVQYLSEVLFKVFVSIEATGESVEFNEKLSYRQPMYAIVDFIWSIPLHRQAIRALAKAALTDMENSDPPLFLKFTNLLVNDAHFLLDEVFERMREVKKEEVTLEESTRLPPHRRQQVESNLEFLASQARFVNIAARDTARTIFMLTSECADFFCHPVMTERLAIMLNYLLVELTGPKTNEMKVKDFSRYEFEPANLLSTIVDVYLSLSNRSEFCLAVTSDERSFSPQLLRATLKVLHKIDVGFDKRRRFEEFSTLLQQKYSACSVSKDELVSQAPEEFLDSLMFTLMTDPVQLPSSSKIVDRSTISRALLSDQMDPFTRAPLTMEQVIPLPELKQQISDWIKEIEENKQNNTIN